jgi:hypothetical protein
MKDRGGAGIERFGQSQMLCTAFRHEAPAILSLAA